MVVGSLREKCSAEEAQSRQRERLLDPLEWRKGCSLQRPEVDFSLATKKYQRSSAGKEFLPEEAIEATGHFLSGHYVRFLRFAASDLWASLVLVDLADLARVRLLWLRARAYHKDDQLV
eukprot:g2747.t1